MRELRVVIRIRPIDIAAALSVLLHLLLFAFGPKPPESRPIGPVTDAPLNVVIAPPEPQPQPAPAAPAPRALPPAPPRPAPAPLTRRTPPPVPAPRVPAPPVEPAPQPVEPREPAVDMMAAIEARRAQREAAEAAARRPSSPPQAPRADAATRNLQTLSGREGVGGVFQILSKGFRTGTFAFNGWRPDSRRQWREVIEVDAGPGGNLELAMVRRMIELIRTHYTGDFQWESHRVGRTVTLSARPQDQRALEDFMMREFFGTPVVNPRVPRAPPP